MTTIMIDKVMALLPHRYPFILVDRVLDYKPYEYLTAQKNVSINEPFFQGHFPGMPVMPGVLMVEALAQAAGVLTLLSHEKTAGIDNLFLLASLEKVRFRKVVVPGDVLILRVDVLKTRQKLWKVQGTVKLDDQVVCDAELMIAKAAGHV
jgi:3-hydroxyacyl-[acyl-carrier-protein] dehydratase